MIKITKLVLPVAGLGKRLLPLTKKTPKNLIIVNGKPILEYALDEALESGIKEVILIVNPLHLNKFRQYINKAKVRFAGMKFHLRTQDKPAGNGHALLPAGDLIGKEPFAVRFCDDILLDSPPVLGSLIKIFEKLNSSVMLLERVPKKMVYRFGVVKVKKLGLKIPRVNGNLWKIESVIEKPKLKDAPSNLTVVGGYILTNSVFRNLKKVAESLPLASPDAIPINIGIQIELIIGNPVYGWEFNGKRLDCGTIEKLEIASNYLTSHAK
jgi:UTP--glucose-1-phosphate uridylyltransferase